MNNKLPNFIRRKQIIGLAILAFFIVLIKLFHFYYQNINKTESPKVDFVAVNSENISIPLTEFNPNDLDEKQWQNLGFSEKQVKTILNYKNVVGGAFVSKEQLKKCYAISEEKFKEIEPYILLPETNSERGNKHYEIHKYEKKSLNISQKVNPDLLSLNDWIKIGFSEKQANAIINYKEYLGGSFISKEKFKECFVISEEYYQKLAPYLLLPEKIPENSTPQKSFTKQEKTKIAYQDFDPNELTAEGWQKLGFSEKQANVIINYKNKYLKGNFKSLEDIEKCFVISAEKFAEMKPFIKIKSHNLPATESSKIENSHNEKVAVVKTDFSKIDLNQITYN
ncbi:MAG: helix-hairpin-helix domain-containing protein, partial [Bergeyella zoohelcum]|nr:helix-hairpin-helix domain-containing protein [Bergeyella zoohelcum]